jgi:hypothetical protein
LSDYQGPIEIADLKEADMCSGNPTGVTSIIIAKGLLHRNDYDVTGTAPGLYKIFSYDLENDTNDSFTVSALNNKIPFKNSTILSLNGKVMLSKSRNNFALLSTTVNISILVAGAYIFGIET